MSAALQIWEYRGIILLHAKEGLQLSPPLYIVETLLNVFVTLTV